MPYELRDKSGRVFAFEIDIPWAGRRRVCAIVGTILGARLTRTPKKLFSWFREEVFCEFELGSVAFEAWEPFGDNSRYWIGPKEPGWHAGIDEVLRAFERAGL